MLCSVQLVSSSSMYEQPATTRRKVLPQRRVFLQHQIERKLVPRLPCGLSCLNSYW